MSEITGGYPHECNEPPYWMRARFPMNSQTPKRWSVKKDPDTGYWIAYHDDVPLYRFSKFPHMVARWRWEEQGKYRAPQPALVYPGEGYCFNVDDNPTWMTPAEAVEGVGGDDIFPSFEDREWLLETPC